MVFTPLVLLTHPWDLPTHHTQLTRVRMIANKLPNTQYYWVIQIPIPNTNNDTRLIISLLPRGAALSGLDTGSKVRYCAHCVNLMSVM